MNAYDSNFHDGFVDGVLIREPQGIVFIKTDDNEAFALLADGVTGMRVDSLPEGNIIFDIVIRRGNDLTRSDVDIHGFAANADGERRATEKLQQLRTEDQVALEINPSYGCECFLIAEAVILVPRSERNNLHLW